MIQIYNIGAVEVDSDYVRFVFVWQILMTILLLLILMVLLRFIVKWWNK